MGEAYRAKYPLKLGVEFVCGFAVVFGKWWRVGWCVYPGRRRGRVVVVMVVGRLGQGILVPHFGHGGSGVPVGSHRVLLVLPHNVVVAYGVVT